jgi:hypothetical protein
MPEEPPRQEQRRPTPLGRAKTRPTPAAQPDPSWEPVIGVDIGLPSPANRIKTDPAAQTRSLVVAIVALGVIVGAVLVAVLISNLGSGDDPPPGTAIDSTQAAGDGLATATTAANGDSSVTPGIVPALKGLTEAEAKQKILAAGFVVSELRAKNSAAKGTVIDQNPQPDTEFPQGQTITIAISEGP